MRISIACCTLALLICSSQTTLAQDIPNPDLYPDKKLTRPDADKGSSLAQRWCASCHVVSSEQSKGIDGTQSFEAIAKSADFNVEKLAFFLLDPHPIMPNMSLSRDEARDIAAYIARLRK